MSPPAATPAPKKSLLWTLTHIKVRARDGANALGGMILGTLVGIGVNKALATTGLLGPGVSTLIAEQKTNFDEVKGRLDALRQTSTDPAVQRALADIGQLLQKQTALAEQSEQQLRLLAQEAAASKDRELAERGMSGGADFWLKGGESYNLGARDQVFGLQGFVRGVANVNLSGTPKRLAVGDVIEFNADGKSCKVFFKQATPREDGRVGFDLDCG
jgi:hypothetical protein